MTMRTTSPLLWLIDLALLGFQFLLCLGILLIATVAIYAEFTDASNLQASLPVTVDGGPVFELASQGDEGVWELRLSTVALTTPPGHVRWWNTVVMVGAGVLTAFIVGRLRRVLRSLRMGSPFVSENAAHLRAMGIAIIALEVLRIVVLLVFIAPTLGTLAPMEGASGDSPLRVDASPTWSLLLLGGLVLILSEVFRHGTAMQDEQALTI